jgi:hypothetical protein
MKVDVHFWSHLAYAFLDWEMFPTEVAAKIGTHILCSVEFCVKSRRSWHKVEKNWTAHKWQYGACAWHAGHLRLQTRSQNMYMGAGKSLARPGRKQATATEDFDKVRSSAVKHNYLEAWRWPPGRPKHVDVSLKLIYTTLLIVFDCPTPYFISTNTTGMPQLKKILMFI